MFHRPPARLSLPPFFLCSANEAPAILAIGLVPCSGSIEKDRSIVTPPVFFFFNSFEAELRFRKKCQGFFHCIWLLFHYVSSGSWLGHLAQVHVHAQILSPGRNFYNFIGFKLRMSDRFQENCKETVNVEVAR